MEVYQQKVSILVPIYNSELYLKSCVDSILNQTYKNLEIILVDDGSTDNSLKICNFYLSVDNRIKVFHKSNQGIALTRNFCISVATGKYIIFVDSDDIIHHRMIEKLVFHIEKYNCEICICGFNRFNDESEIEYSIGESKEVFLTGNELKEQFFLNHNIGFANWNKMYLRKIADKLRFENIILGEDYLYNSEYFKYVNHAVVIDEQLYYYRMTYNSLSNLNKFDERKMDCQILSRRKAFLNFSDSPAQKFARDQYLISMIMALIWSAKQKKFNRKNEKYIKYKKMISMETSKSDYFQLSKKRFIQLLVCLYFPEIMRLK